MWHEAKNHERAQRAWMVDRRKRAERRREFYESINVNPLNYLKVLGKKCTVNVTMPASQQQQQIEPTPHLLHAATDPIRSADASAAVHYGSASSFTNKSWLDPGLNNNDNNSAAVDRFDVRSHLDDFMLQRLASAAKQLSDEQDGNKLSPSVIARLNYERYRNLIKSKLAEVREEKIIACIRQANDEDSPMNKRLDSVKRTKQQLKSMQKRSETPKASFGFDYGANDPTSTTISAADVPTVVDSDEILPPSSPSLTVEELESAITFTDLNQWNKNDAGMAVVAEQYGGIPLKTFKLIMLEDCEREEQLKQQQSDAVGSANSAARDGGAEDAQQQPQIIQYCDAAVRADLQQVSPEGDAETMTKAKIRRRSQSSSSSSSRRSRSPPPRRKRSPSIGTPPKSRRKRTSSSSSSESSSRKRLPARREAKKSHSPEYSPSSLSSSSREEDRRKHRQRRRRSPRDRDNSSRYRKRSRSTSKSKSGHREHRHRSKYSREKNDEHTNRNSTRTSAASSSRSNKAASSSNKKPTAETFTTTTDVVRKLKPAEIIKLKMQQVLKQTQLRDQKAERIKQQAAAVATEAEHAANMTNERRSPS